MHNALLEPAWFTECRSCLNIFPNAHAGMIRIRDEIVSKLLDQFSKHSDVSTCKLTVLLNTDPNKARLTKLRQSLHRVSSFIRSCSFYSLKTRGHTSHHPRSYSPNYLLFCMPLSRFLTLWMHHTNALELRRRQAKPLKFSDRNFVVCYSLAVVVHIGSRCQARSSKCHHKPISAHIIRQRLPL